MLLAMMMLMALVLIKGQRFGAAGHGMIMPPSCGLALFSLFTPPSHYQRCCCSIAQQRGDGDYDDDEWNDGEDEDEGLLLDRTGGVATWRLGCCFEGRRRRERRAERHPGERRVALLCGFSFFV